MEAQKGQILLTCSGQPATLEDLKGMAIPEKTDTYTPLGHWDFVTSVARMAMEMLGCEIESAAYATTHEGARMFGVMSLKNGHTQEGTFRALALRNSTDKSMVAGVAGGLRVWACSNLVLSGDAFRVLKKHTGALMDKLESGIITALYKARTQFRELEEDMEAMQQLELTDRQAWGFFGQALGEEIIKPKKMGFVLDDWKVPRHEEFSPRTMWSAYNCITDHLKGLPPGKILQAHSRLHSLAMDLPGLDHLKAAREVPTEAASSSLKGAATLGE